MITPGTPGSASFTVKLAQAVSQPVSVTYTTADGTAKAGIDYTATSGTLTFAPGQTIPTFSVPLLGAQPTSSDDAFSLNLVSSNVGVYASGTGTIMADVSSEVSVTRGAYRYSFVNRNVYQSVTITNTGSAPIIGPLALILSGLPSGVSLMGGTGVTSGGSPYLNVLGSASVLGVGQSVTVMLDFSDPSLGAISFNTRLVAGQGSL